MSFIWKLLLLIALVGVGTYYLVRPPEPHWSRSGGEYSNWGDSAVGYRTSPSRLDESSPGDLPESSRDPEAQPSDGPFRVEPGAIQSYFGTKSSTGGDQSAQLQILVTHGQTGRQATKARVRVLPAGDTEELREALRGWALGLGEEAFEQQAYGLDGAACDKQGACFVRAPSGAPLVAVAFIDRPGTTPLVGTVDIEGLDRKERRIARVSLEAGSYASIGLEAPHAAEGEERAARVRIQVVSESNLSPVAGVTVRGSLSTGGPSLEDQVRKWIREQQRGELAQALLWGDGLVTGPGGSVDCELPVGLVFKFTAEHPLPRIKSKSVSGGPLTNEGLQIFEIAMESPRGWLTDQAAASLGLPTPELEKLGCLDLIDEPLAEDWPGPTELSVRLEILVKSPAVEERLRRFSEDASAAGLRMTSKEGLSLEANQTVHTVFLNTGVDLRLIWMDRTSGEVIGSASLPALKRRERRRLSLTPPTEAFGRLPVDDMSSAGSSQEKGARRIPHASLRVSVLDGNSGKVIPFARLLVRPANSSKRVPFEAWIDRIKKHPIGEAWLGWFEPEGTMMDLEASTDLFLPPGVPLRLDAHSGEWRGGLTLEPLEDGEHHDVILWTGIPTTNVAVQKPHQERLESDQRAPVVVIKPGSIRGTFQDQAGKPLRHLPLWIIRDFGTERPSRAFVAGEVAMFQDWTDREGRFEFESLPAGNYWLGPAPAAPCEKAEDGLQKLARWIGVQEDQALSMDFTLARGLSFRGILQHSPDRPLRRARVVLEQASLPKALQAHTSDEGEVFFSGLADEPLHLTVQRLEQVEPARFGPYEPSETTRTIVLNPGSSLGVSLRGLRDADEAITLHLLRLGAVPREIEAVQARDGVYQFTELRAGDYALTAVGSAGFFATSGLIELGREATLQLDLEPREYSLVELAHPDPWPSRGTVLLYHEDLPVRALVLDGVQPGVVQVPVGPLTLRMLDGKGSLVTEHLLPVDAGRQIKIDLP